MPVSAATCETEYRPAPPVLPAHYASTSAEDYRLPDENGEMGEGSIRQDYWTGRTWTALERFRLPHPGSVPQPRRVASVFRPRTSLGRRLLDIRSRIVASGVRLRGWSEIERELAERRGRED
jgi:hypothetical protein